MTNTSDKKARKQREEITRSEDKSKMNLCLQTIAEAVYPRFIQGGKEEDKEILYAQHTSGLLTS